METIYVTYKNGDKAEFTGSDLTERWDKIGQDPDAQTGDYYRPGKTRPRVLVAYFGNIETTLPV